MKNAARTVSKTVAAMFQPTSLPLVGQYVCEVNEMDNTRKAVVAVLATVLLILTVGVAYGMVASGGTPATAGAAGYGSYGSTNGAYGNAGAYSSYQNGYGNPSYNGGQGGMMGGGMGGMMGGNRMGMR